MQSTIAGGKTRNILGFQWVELLNIDLFIVTNRGVDFYKLNHKTHKLSHVKGFTQPTGLFWYHREVLVISSTLPKLGNFHTFFLNKGSKSLPGPRFKIDLSPSATDNWTAKAVNSSRVAKDTETFQHRVLLCNLYGNSVFVHVNSARSRLTLYFLSESRVSVNDTFEPLPEGSYAIQCVDNVLIVMNVTQHETYLYDIGSYNFANRPFCALWNGVQPDVPQLSLQIDVVIEDTGVIVYTKVLYDGRILSDSTTSAVSACTSISHIVETSADFSPEHVSLGPELALDIEGGRILRFVFDFALVVKEHPDRLEGILFLFRRNGYRAHGLEYLRQALKNKVPLASLSLFFDEINSVYKRANQERTHMQVRRSAFLGNARISYREDPQSVTGETVLQQSDMYASVFIPLFEQKSVQPLYFTSVVLEYIHSLTAHEIPLGLNLQILLARLLVRSHSYTLIEELILHNTFTDSRDLAHLLLSLSKSDSLFPAAFQLAIDMLTRLKLYGEVADVFLNRGFPYEVARMTSSANPPRYDITKLYKQSDSINDPEFVDSVQTFMKKVLSSQLR